MIKNTENVIAKSSENGISRIIIDHPKSYNSLSEKTIKSPNTEKNMALSNEMNGRSRV